MEVSEIVDRAVEVRQQSFGIYIYVKKKEGYFGTICLEYS